ncbi:MAG: hypothetical protein HC884_06520 [Chloroflexaceae bacterium]|nr:hypothetical protein [Chloroflexaceae bacterium]
MAPAQEALQLFTRMGGGLPTLYCRRTILIANLLRWHQVHTLNWQELVGLWVEAGFPLEAARTRIYLAFYLYLLIETEGAHALIEEITPIVRQEGTATDWAFLLSVRAGISLDRGKSEQAMDDINQAENIFRQEKNLRQAAICQFRRSWIWQQCKEFDRARAELEQALQTLRRLDLPLHIALCERNLGMAFYRLGHYGEAMQRVYQAQRYFQSLGRLDTLADCALSLGNIAYYTRSYAIAVAHYRQSQHIYNRLNNAPLWILSQRNQAMALCAMERPTAALDILTSLEKTSHLVSQPLEFARLLHTKAQVLADLGRYCDARILLQEVEKAMRA